MKEFKNAELKKNESEITPKYIAYCYKHPDCCSEKGCPAEFGYYPDTGREVFKKCGC